MSVSFRLMSGNLLTERSDIAHFSRVVADFDPDVVVTQELGAGAADVLASIYRNHSLHPSSDVAGRGIATRFDCEFADIAMPGRHGTAATLSVGGEKVRLAGIHLLNPIDFPWWATAKLRGRQVDALLRWVEAGAGPVVVAGDFNASPAWPAYRRVASRLTDLIDEAASSAGEPARATWGWRPGWPRMLRIDHVFGSGVHVVDNLLVPIDGSDHAAIVVDIVLSGPVT